MLVAEQMRVALGRRLQQTSGAMLVPPHRSKPALLHESDSAASTSRFGVLLTVAYDGRPFSGFARQTNARTIAGELEGAVRAIDPRASHVRGLSRTDAGVHARAQLVAFDTSKWIAPRGWTLALTQHLPEEIAIVRAATVDDGFDPRLHATRKSYRYSIFHSQVRDPFLEGRAWRIFDRFNHSELEAVAQTLVGEHDFAAFRGAEDQRTDTVRQIFRIEVRRAHSDDRITWIDVEGDRFMYKMVRIIVGTMADIGRGRIDSSAFTHALATRERTQLGMTAPPYGLCLERVVMSVDGRDPWPRTH
jgi:tRNA pseudouridine38-40 synthase